MKPAPPVTRIVTMYQTVVGPVPARPLHSPVTRAEPRFGGAQHDTCSGRRLPAWQIPVSGKPGQHQELPGCVSPGMVRNGSEGNVVFKPAVIKRGGVVIAGRCLPATIVAAFVKGRAARGSAAVEHLHFVGNDFGGPAVLAVLALPLARLDATLDVNLGALAQVLAGNFAQAAKHDHAMPFGALAHFTRLPVAPGLGGCNANIGDRAAARGVAGFRVSTKISNQYCLVDSTRHGMKFSFQDSASNLSGSLAQGRRPSATAIARHHEGLRPL